MTDYVSFLQDAIVGVPIIGPAVNAIVGLVNGDYDGGSESESDSGADAFTVAMTTQLTSYLAQLQAMDTDEVRYYAQQYDVDFNQLSNLRKQLISVYQQLNKQGVITDKAREMVSKIENAKVQQVTGSQRQELEKAHKRWQQDYQLSQRKQIQQYDDASKIEGTIQDLQDISSRPVTTKNDKAAAALQQSTGVRISKDKIYQGTEIAKKKQQAQEADT